MDGVLIVGIVFYSIYKIIELFVRQKERRLMVEKMGEVPKEMLQSNVQSFNELHKDGLQTSRFSPLRWGAVLVGAGLGWIIGFSLYTVFRNCGFQASSWHDTYQSILLASVALCAGIALIVVYLIERNAYKKAKKEE